MLRYRSAVTRKGQVTIPKEIRDEFGLSEGDKVEWSREDGKIILQPAGSIVERTFGVFRHLAEPMNRDKSIEHILAEEEAAVEQAMMEDWLESEKRS
jgi:AbrB family looped-hinge helix DNA binding protein